MQTMWTEYYSSNPGKLHIVSANTHDQTSSQINGANWRTKFNPNLTFHLATKQMLGFTYGEFGNGYVPMNVIIGGGNRIIYSANAMPDNSIIDQAIASLNNYVSLVNPVQNQEIKSGQSVDIDLANVCIASDGSKIVYSIETISNTELLSGTISYNTLTLTGSEIIGIAKVRVKAAKGDICGYFEISVRVTDPGSVELLNSDFEVFPPTGWINDKWAKGSGGVIGSCAKAAYSPAGTKTLTTPPMNLPADITAKLSFLWKNKDINKVVGHDSTFCEITNDNGITWTKLNVLSPLAEQSTFTQVVNQLDAYKGQTIQIRWRYKTDGGQSAYGVGLDEIVVCYPFVGISNESMPASFNLLQNYPNPFNPTTTISFNLLNETVVKLTIYNQIGEEVTVLANKKMAPGMNNICFDGRSLNSGVYFYTLQTGDNRQTCKMLLIK